MNKEEFSELCISGDIDSIRDVLESGDGDLDVLVDIGGADVITLLCRAKRSRSLDQVLDSIFIHICKRGMHELYMPMIEAGFRPTVHGTLNSAIYEAVKSSLPTSRQIIANMFHPRSVQGIGVPYFDPLASHDPDFVEVLKLADDATLCQMHDTVRLYDFYPKFLRAVLNQKRFHVVMDRCKPRDATSIYRLESEDACKEFISWAFHEARDNTILSPQFKAFVDGVWPGNKTQLTDPIYLFDAASNLEEFIYFELQPGPYTLLYDDYTHHGPNFTYDERSARHLIDVINRPATLMYLLSKLPAEDVFGDPVSSLLSLFEGSLGQDSKMKEFIVKHPAMIPQVVRHDVWLALKGNDDLRQYAEQQAKIRYDSGLGMLLHQNGLDDAADATMGSEHALYHVITRCFNDKSGKMLRNVIHVTGIVDLDESTGKYFLSQAVASGRGVMRAWFEICVPLSWYSYRTKVIEMFYDDATITPDEFEVFAYANREGLTRRITRRWTDRTLEGQILTSYNLRNYGDDDAMTMALLVQDARRVAALLYCGYPIPADYILPDEDRTTLIGKMVRTFRRGDLAYMQLMSGKAKIAFLKNTMIAFKGAQQAMPFIPIEIKAEIIAMLPPQSFPPDDGIPALSPAFVDILLAKWETSRKL